MSIDERSCFYKLVSRSVISHLVTDDYVYLYLKKYITQLNQTYLHTKSFNHNLIVVEELSSLTALTWHIGMKTAF